MTNCRLQFKLSVLINVSQRIIEQAINVLCEYFGEIKILERQKNQLAV